jgi:hypothetical protein
MRPGGFIRPTFFGPPGRPVLVEIVNCEREIAALPMIDEIVMKS